MIRLRELTRIFGQDQSRVIAFENITLDIARGEFLCLLGPSGCGKTTILRNIGQIDTPTSGDLHLDFQPDAEGAAVSMVFQQHGLYPWMTVEGNLRFALRSSPLPRKLHDTIVDRFIGKVGLSRFRKFYPHQLSGGMNQRVNLIRAFCVYPQLLLLDEPFVALDYQNRYRMQELLLQLWAEQHQTIVFVTHNINEAINLGDRVAVMTSSPGRIKEIFPVPFERPRDVFALRKDPRFSKLAGDISDVIRDEVEKASKMEEEICLLGNVKEAQ